jgi:hypothetical protein
LTHSLELTSSWHRPVWEQALAWLVWTLAGQRWALRFRRPRARAFRTI